MNYVATFGENIQIYRIDVMFLAELMSCELMNGLSALVIAQFHTQTYVPLVYIWTVVD